MSMVACSRRSDSGEQCEVKRSASLPSPPLLFIAFFTSHRSPLSERLEQAMSMAREEHKLKTKVLKLKEWKLMHQCDKMGIGLPPAYDTDKDNC